jgi:hypothetical protein
MLGLVWRFLRRNSIQNQNFSLIGMEINWANGMFRDTKPGRNSWREDLQLLIGLSFVFVFNALFSWILLLPAFVAIPIQIYKRLTTPAAMKEATWRMSNIPYRTAEDFLALCENLYLPGGSKSTAQFELEETQQRVEKLVFQFAEEVYGDSFAKVAAYVEAAKKLSNERFHTSVIHPTFWMIPPRKYNADEAVGWV